MNFAKQLYDRALVDLQGTVKHAWIRQEQSITADIDIALKGDGIDNVVDLLNDVITFSLWYDGKPPYYGDLFNAISELRGDAENPVHPRDSSEFRKQARLMGERNLLHIYKIDPQSGVAERRDGSAYIQENGAESLPEPPSRIQEALDIQQKELDMALRLNDEDGIRSAQMVIKNIEAQLERENPKAAEDHSARNDEHGIYDDHHNDGNDTSKDHHNDEHHSIEPYAWDGYGDE